MTKLDAYVNKTVPFKFMGADMSFELSHGLFSSFDIDSGSRLLLKVVARNVEAAAVGSILDIGSGVGVLGIACARAYPGASLRMRDRDSLACAFSERNARRNKVKPESVDHALFLDGLAGQRFDLVLCNVPAKAGTPVLDRFLHELVGVVSERGRGAVVVVEPIAKAALESILASGAEIVVSEAGAGHTAIMFRRGAAVEAAAETISGTEWAVMERSEQTLRAGRATYRFKGYWGLPEFDTPSFATQLAMDLCEDAMAGSMVRRVAIVNPGPGRVACYVRARAKAAVIDLCGRDALELAAAARNLALAERPEAPAGMATADADGLPAVSYDLVIEIPDVTPRVDTIAESWAHAARVLKSGGSYIAAMPSAVMDRFEKKRPKGFTRVASHKKKGFACAAWRLG